LDNTVLEQLSQKLLYALTSGSGVEELITIAGKVLGNPLAVGSTDFEVIHTTPDMPDDSITPSSGVVRNLHDAAVFAGIEYVFASDDPVYLDSLSYGSKYNSIVSTMRSEGQIIGYVSMCLSNREMLDTDITALKIVRQALVLSIMASMDVHFVSNNAISAILNELLFGEGDIGNSRNLIVRKLDIRVWPLRVVVCGYANHYQATAPPKAARNELLSLLGTNLYISKPGSLTILTGKDIFPIDDTVNEFLKKHKLMAGVSYPFHNLRHTNLFYSQARYCLDYISSADTPLSYFSISADRYLFHATGEGRFADCRLTAAITLLEYDKKNDTDLCLTLRTYYSQSCSASQTAKTLGVHVNTVIQRLERIESLLSDYHFCRDSVFALFICLKTFTDIDMH